MKRFRASEAIKIIKRSEPYKELMKLFSQFSGSQKERIKKRLRAVLELGREIIPRLRQRLKDGEEGIFDELIKNELPHFIALWTLIEGGYISINFK